MVTFSRPCCACCFICSLLPIIVSSQESARASSSQRNTITPILDFTFTGLNRSNIRMEHGSVPTPSTDGRRVGEPTVGPWRRFCTDSTLRNDQKPKVRIFHASKGYFLLKTAKDCLGTSYFY